MLASGLPDDAAVTRPLRSPRVGFPGTFNTVSVKDWLAAGLIPFEAVIESG
jgi:hypothetical protein